MTRPPLVLVPQYFGSTVFDRRTSRYIPFDRPATEFLRSLCDKDAETVIGHADPKSRAAILDFYDRFYQAGFFTLEGRFAGVPLDITPPPDHLSGPLALHVEVVAACNLKCIHCFAGDLPRKEEPLSLGELDRLFSQMAAMGTFRLGLTGGEPLLRKDLFEIIDLAISHGLCPCVTTNGLLITREIAQEFCQRELVWLNVSLEGATAPTNDMILIRENDLHAAAVALDGAYGLAPEKPAIAQARAMLLDRLSVTEHGILFRNIPGGSFSMGSTRGEADEQPVHLVDLHHYWLSETPISWDTFCRVMDWEAPPIGGPRLPAATPADKHFDRERFELFNDNKIRLQYCENQTLAARDWHAHQPNLKVQRAGETIGGAEVFGKIKRSDPATAFGYTDKPMVCVRFHNADGFCEALSKIAPSQSIYRLPTEAEWEKAARGGLIGCNHPWGDQPPSQQTCDFGRFDNFAVTPAKTFPANGYGLYAMSGGVWEWTSDWYDAEYYAESPAKNPTGSTEGNLHVVRGGSWADCAQAVTVSFRMGMGAEHFPTPVNPNIGFRVCRTLPANPA